MRLEKDLKNMFLARLEMKQIIYGTDQNKLIVYELRLLELTQMNYNTIKSLMAAGSTYQGLFT
jgi:hypothetical protein